MIASLERMGERLLTRVVPKATAQAAGLGPYCDWKSCGPGCLLKICCAVPGEPYWCGRCRWTC
ncbi:hypothetical protein [Actinomadura sp. CNU-125]|uniref:hypothetical protein n=1 Tax=Actinomadura sp. CNU-125 TaxID=1904961 RepID=UPI001177D745|nr:hypothetical protein [Actinomadura sp. CNU-125]